MDKLPASSSDLIRELDKAFPSRCPDLRSTDREIWFYAGKRALVEHLLARLRKTEGAAPGEPDDEPDEDLPF